MTSTTTTVPPKVKTEHVRFLKLRLKDLCPAPENDQLYRKVHASDPEIKALAASIREHGLREPLVVTADHFILSGHRRHVAARLAGHTSVLCRVEPIRRCDDLDAFVVLLREHNRQREKTFDERLREELVTVSPDEAYESLIEHRRQKARIDAPAMPLGAVTRRSVISAAKAEMMDGVKSVIEARREYWPLSDRQIHYALLNDPPLRHASKPHSRYVNDRRSYADLCDLLTRGRLAGIIPWEAIGDETRPVVIWDVHREPGAFIRQELDSFLMGYCRDLMQSQPNYIEVAVEKNTVAGMLKDVCSRYTIPMTSGRGYCSINPRRDMQQRFFRSGKSKLILLIVSDFDPDGDVIAESFATSMRDDFGVTQLHPIKVSLTHEQVKHFNLPLGGKAKSKPAERRAKFVKKYGSDDVWELEALQPAVLQQLLTDAIDSVIDVDAFNAELDAERRDAAHIEGVRRTLRESMRGCPELSEGDDA